MTHDDDSAWDDDDLVDADDSDDEPTVPGPACGREMLEDCDHCAACGHWRDDDDASRSPRPAWVVATAVACLAIAVWWILLRP
jgi:hypothetical protein